MSNPKPNLPELKEEEIQASIVDGLTWKGYVVHQTTNRGTKCTTCGKKVFGSYGATEGTPDLMITHPKWPHWTWFGIEVKRSERAKVSDAQQELHNRMRIVIVWSWEQAIDAVHRFELQLGIRI